LPQHLDDYQRSYVMSYQKPELFLVGAAKGVVLGSQGVAQLEDHETIRNCVDGLSRDTFEPC
jgi:hypothetical protein